MSVYQLGIDISAIQHNINWARIHDNIPLFGVPRPVKYVSIKVSEGGHAWYPEGINDGLAHQHASNAAQNNLPIGYYHFARYHKKEGDAAQQAIRFYNQIQTLPTPTIHQIIDSTNGKATKDYYLDAETNDENLTPEQWERWNNDFINKFIELKPGAKGNIGIYSYKYILDANLKPNHSLGNYDLWLAGYGRENQLQLPHGWNHWQGWQFSGNGQHPAISGNVDYDFVK